MKKRDNTEIKVAAKYTFYVLLLLSVIFIGATFVWILITPYTITQFNFVLSKVLKNAGSYSVLLVGVVITTFFQVYFKEKEIEKEERIKIGEVGYYTLAFKREEDEYEEEYIGNKLVVEIDKESDYEYEDEKENQRYIHVMIKFLTSKSVVTNLKI